MARNDGILASGGDASGLLQAGFTQHAFYALAAQYPDGSFASEVWSYIYSSAKSVTPLLKQNYTVVASKYPLDRLSNGRALIDLSQKHLVEDDADVAADLGLAYEDLLESVDENKRNAEGGLWYYTYPEWSYLDGMYSYAPFVVNNSVWIEKAAQENGLSGPFRQNVLDAVKETYHQLDLLWQHTHQDSNGLLAHGYDDSRKASWADSKTGSSPHVWGRSLGWYAMALVDTLEIIPDYETHYRGLICEKWNTLAKSITKAVDSKTGGWWQVLDKPGQKGNYIESSGTAMFSYALLKGLRLGHFSSDPQLSSDAKAAGIRAQKYLTEKFVVEEKDGYLGYDGTVSVCSLNSSATYDYYIGQPIKYNSVLGSAAYVLASLEAERLGA
ncbi:glycoside hydrolase family 105 protein [Daldinia sp. FL1419]|nr:glycoside hydrolase family 105 protein [Daldinia sp. FL1419]